VAHGRRAASFSLAALVIVGCGCSSQSSATPTLAHRRPPPSTGVTTTTAPVPTTTTGPPSAIPTTVPAPAVQVPGWAGSLTALPPGGGFTSVSCISDTFCVAAGGGTTGDISTLTAGSGVTMSWDGAAWSNPSVYYPAPATGQVAAPVLPAITCTSGPTCVIGDGSGHVSDGDGTNWLAPSALPPAPALPANPADPGVGHLGSRATAVSCPTPTFCAFADNTGHTYTLHNGDWGTPQSFGELGGLGAPAVSLYQAGMVGVSCPTSSTCAAVVGTSVLDWDGSTWTQEPSPWTSALVSGPSDPTAIACPSTSLCFIVNGTGVSMRTAGDQWSAEATIDPHGELDSISCPSTSFCLAADQSGSVVMWNGTTWSTPVQVIPAATEYTGIGTSVSCPSAQFCMVMNSDGDYATYTGPGPASP
jgi:hypothetical protein